ncbi:efflux RND transporter periplasmic adaptor subunit [Bacillus sp. 2205SS5-2]|uniref:efflux RND transporter periplasmic adaptor subunit n=1 Tax=Bacillus sp. 2205SS5-2 TaxID=3109031 RepID=UPI003006C81F
MMKKKNLLLLFSILLITLNVFFIQRNLSSIPKISYIADWDYVGTSTLRDVLKSEGVVVPLDEFYVTIDENRSFSEIFVEEGDTIEVGTPLFAYDSDELDEEVAEVERQKDVVDVEIKSVKTYISNLKSTSRSLPSFNSTGEEDHSEEKASKLQIEYSLDADIAAAEVKLDLLEAQSLKYKDELIDLKNEQSGGTVESKVAGIVGEISYSLDNPFITIKSDSTMITGTLSEAETATVKPAMKTVVTSLVLKESFDGAVSEIETYPAQEPDSMTESRYPYSILLTPEEEEVNEFSDSDGESEDLDADEDTETDEDVEIPVEEAETLWPGYHVSVDIITAEATDVNVLPKKSVEMNGLDYFVWGIRPNGSTMKIHVTKGLEVNNLMEVKDGIEKGDLFLPNKKAIAGDQSPIITPLHPSQVKVKELKEMNRYLIMKNILFGLVER